MYPLVAQLDFLSNAGPSHYKVPSLLSKSCESTHRQAPAYTQVGRSVKGGFHEDFGKVTSITARLYNTMVQMCACFAFLGTFSFKRIMRAGVNTVVSDPLPLQQNSTCCHDHSNKVLHAPSPHYTSNITEV